MTEFKNDGLDFPWVKEFTDVWHRRFPTDSWFSDDDRSNARGVCGARLHSAHVSPTRPASGKFCAGCV